MMQAQSIFFAKDKKDDEDVPEGFAKFLKKTRKGRTVTKDEKESKKKEEDKKAKENKDDDEFSELEEEVDTKEKDGKKDGDKG